MPPRRTGGRKPQAADFLPELTDDIRSSLAKALAAAPFRGSCIPGYLYPFSVFLDFCVRHWGTFSWVRPRTWKAWLQRLLVLLGKSLLWFHVGFILATCLLLFIFRTVNPGSTWLMVDRRLDAGWKIQKPVFIPLNKIPKLTRTMTIRLEDGTFYSHHGFELSAFKNAWQLNKRFGTPMYGGSTITMQTARTLFLTPEKSYLRKYLELIIALEMEAILGKDRILELYFNYAEWGKGLFGIEAAARRHYGVGVGRLSLDAAMRLVTLLSSPIRFSPDTLHRSTILKTRYAYLVSRFAPKPEEPPPATDATQETASPPEQAAPEAPAEVQIPATVSTEIPVSAQP